MSAGSIVKPAMAAVDQARRAANAELAPDRKSALGQYMPPGPVADLMASMFSAARSPVRLLDAGAGVGSLTAAFVNCGGWDELHVSAYEIDPVMTEYLRGTLARLESPGLTSRIISRDFIQDAVFKLKLGTHGELFTRAILNPPYKKLNSCSSHRALLRRVGLETVNLYTAFVGLSLELMDTGGELVAIIPRSFCNGLYYKPFRNWILSRASLERIHLFHSRTSAFHDDAVLQENVIIKLVRDRPQGNVVISTSSDASCSDLELNSYPFAEIVNPADRQKFIHVPTTPGHGGLDGIPLADHSLNDLGFTVSTGPVVDFRLKPYLRFEPVAGSVPLL